nr:hypothetical protein [Hyphomonas sp. Mor2]
MITLFRLKLAWTLLLAIFFIWFCAWYGGAGKPISLEEGQRLLERLQHTHGDDDAGQRGFLTNVAEMIPRDDGREFYAVNLENLKDGPEAERADRAYAAIVMPLLFKRASHPVIVSERVGLMLGEYGNEVDRVAVVRYRSLRDMIDMAAEPAMDEGEVYKFAALDHTEVFITRPFITFMHIRITLALILILIGWLGLRGMDWFSRRARQA